MCEINHLKKIILCKIIWYDVEGVCFTFLLLLWIRDLKNGLSQKREAEKLIERYFQLLFFGSSNFLISQKLIKITKS
jgi:hypothetical protein